MFHLLVIFCLSVSFLNACTAFQLQAQDGSKIYCRSLEFGFSFQSDLLIVSRGTVYTGTAPGQNQGIRWGTKYGFVGLNQTMASNWVSDGMNEKGLVVGCLYLPGYAQYERASPQDYERTLGAWELTAYLLSNCATVQEVKALLPTLVVAQEPMPQLNNFMLPLHFHISDLSGACIAVEYVGGERQVFDNPIGVLTNSPPFDWQLIHLQGYVNLTNVNAAGLNFKNNYKVQFAGQGSGLLGLPGDYTPPSRFVRAALFTTFATMPKNALGTVRLGFHLLNTFDIFDGAIKSSTQDEKKKVPPGFNAADITQWVVVHDQSNRRTYFRSYESLAVQMVDLKQIDFTEPGFRIIPMKREFTFENVTDNSKTLQIKE